MPIGLKGNSDGSGAIQIGGSDAISISTGLNTTFAGTITATGTVAGTTGTLYPLVSGTAVSATGTAVDFTGIPSWVKRITVMFSGVSTNGGSNYIVQIGAGSITSTGYLSTASSGTAVSNTTIGFLLCNNLTSATNQSGISVIATLGSNVWVNSTTCGANAGSNVQTISNGNITLGGTLDRVRITTVNGTDTFDAGTINILFE